MKFLERLASFDCLGVPKQLLHCVPRRLALSGVGVGRFYDSCYFADVGMLIACSKELIPRNR